MKLVVGMAMEEKPPLPVVKAGAVEVEEEAGASVGAAVGSSSAPAGSSKRYPSRLPSSFRIKQANRHHAPTIQDVSECKQRLHTD